MQIKSEEIPRIRIDIMHIGKKIKELAEEKKIGATQFSKEMGLSRRAIYDIFKKESMNTEQARKIAAVLGVDLSVLIPADFGNATHLEAPAYLELPYISVPARASFVEMVANEEDFGYPDTFRIVADPTINYTGQVVIEVDGDSMDPYYPSGTKVRCKEIPRADWEYLNSGVYAVSYSNYFVIKRIKSNDYKKGYIALHSDNTDTGGSVEVPIEQLHYIWRVLRIVDAPAR